MRRCGAIPSSTKPSGTRGVLRTVAAASVLAGVAVGAGCAKPPQRVQSASEPVYAAPALPPPAPAASQAAPPEARTEPVPCGLPSEDLVGSLARETDWDERERLFADILRVNDPRNADALFAYIQSRPHRRLAFLAAVALARVGDLRAIETLAKRLLSDDTELVLWSRPPVTDRWAPRKLLQPRREDERLLAARLVADLAQLHPEKRDYIRENTEDALIELSHASPWKYREALRALAILGSVKDIESLRKWSTPSVSLPPPGAPPPIPEEWMAAGSVLQFLGSAKDEPSWTVLEEALRRRPKELDATMAALQREPRNVVRAMVLRSLGVSAAEAFSEWGDHRAFKPLLEYIDQPKENDQAHAYACEALLRIADTGDVTEIAKRLEKAKLRHPDPRAACLLDGLSQRGFPGFGSTLLSLLTPGVSPELGILLARAIARSGIDPELEASLLKMTSDRRLMNYAALALILGGSTGSAVRAVAAHENQPPSTLNELGVYWFQSIDGFFEDDLSSGALLRWAENAAAVGALVVHGARQWWAPDLLAMKLADVANETGTRSLTRVVLRNRLRDIASGDDEARRHGAIVVLGLMRERGVLASLASGNGAAAGAARSACADLRREEDDPRLANAVRDLPSGGKLVAELQTDMGALQCELWPEKAPLTVANFVGLARGRRPWFSTAGAWVQRPLYDGTPFHRIVKGFMIQGGDPTGKGTGEAGFNFPDEIWDGARHDRRGLLCMANRGPDTNSSQFFILDGAAPHLDGGYTIFGQCSPDDVIAALASTPVSGDRPVKPPMLRKVTISRTKE